MQSSLPIQLCFGQVRHQRLRPRRHRFAYSAYFLRVLIRGKAYNSASARLFSHNRFNLLSWHDADYGYGENPEQWIDQLLQVEGITDACGEIWLQTFPRVLGYGFNPVSFWFCHRIDGALRAVLCEVNNTFGERHFYLLDAGRAICNGMTVEARKIFHVSPFCRVEGQYRFRFHQESGGAATPARSLARIELHTDDGPLIIASISGRAEPLTNRSVAKAFFGYPLQGLMIMVRIHWQALRLAVKRIPFFRKPALPSVEVSR